MFLSCDSRVNDSSLAVFALVWALVPVLSPSLSPPFLECFSSSGSREFVNRSLSSSPWTRVFRVVGHVSVEL